jgi:hypothetical protein
VQNFLAWGADDDRWPKRSSNASSCAADTDQDSPAPRAHVDELVLLIDVSRERFETVAGVSGKQRALMYRTLVSTGLRFGELTRLA